MDIFTYGGQKNKALREIDRLIKSEAELDQESSIDHALNAASTIYHLIEWRHFDRNPNSKIKAHDFALTTTNQAIKVLHGVVTRSKHVKVTVKAYPDEITPYLKDNCHYVTTEDGKTLTTQKNSPLVTEDSYIKVYFGTLEGLPVLIEAMREFK